MRYSPSSNVRSKWSSRSDSGTAPSQAPLASRRSAPDSCTVASLPATSGDRESAKVIIA